jgi:HEAT repeat protein
MTDTPDTQSTNDERVSEEHGGLENVRDILNALVKFIHGKKIYAKNNPTLVKFAKEFDAALQKFFQAESELVLAIDRHQIKWRDAVVYENEKRDESIAFLLFKDGIGEISILSAVTFNELEKLVDLLGNEVHNFKADEDVVTKFWKADFDKISYRVLDEYLVGQFGEGRPDDAAQTPLESEDHQDLPSFQDKGRVIIEHRDSLESITAYLDTLVDQSFPAATSDERETHFQSMAEYLFQVSSQELRTCQNELDREKDDDVLIAFQKAIIDFTLLNDNPSVVRDTMNILECVVDYLLTEAKPNALGACLHGLRRFQTEKGPAETVKTFLQGLEDKLTKTEFLVALANRLSDVTGSPEEVFGYYKIVGKKSLPTICAMLEDLDGVRLHRLACDTLIEVAGEDVVEAMEKLRIDVSQVAQDMVYLIEKTGTKKLPDLVEELMYYPDNRVREEVIGFLVKADTPDSASLLVKLMDDADKQIRMKTLLAVESSTSPIITNKLIAMAFDKDLSKKAIDEQESIFKVLGKLAGESILPDLADMAEKKALFMFGKQQTKQSKLLVIRALENMKSAAAGDLLETLARDQNDLVKSRARRALDKMQLTPRQVSKP